jgi:hypothetical protein
MINPEQRIPDGWVAGSLHKPDERFFHSNVGKLWITDETISRRIYAGDPIPEGWRKGHHHHRSSNRNPQVGRYKNPERRREIGINRGFVLTDEQRRIFGKRGADALTQEQRDFAKAKMQEATRGSIWITDGSRSKRVNPNEPMPYGWKKGRPKNWYQKANSRIASANSLQNSSSPESPPTLAPGTRG